MKLAILLGAGASYGCGNVVPERPPLGAELFERLKRAYPDSWGSLLTHEENEAFKEDFEVGMDGIWQRQSGNAAQLLLIDMALYFSKFRATGANCYSRLLDVVGAPGMESAFCTLNYDLLFEQAVARSGRSLRTLGRVMGTGPPVGLLKPHGSCNYIDPVTRNVHRSTMGVTQHFVYREGPPQPADLEIVTPDELARIYSEGPTIPPAISIYMPTKHSPVGFTIIQSVRANWAQVASKADVILSIGTRPVEQDAHIWDPVLQSKVDVWFVGGQDADYGRRAWKLGARMQYLGATFAGSLPEIRRRLELGHP